MAWALNRVCGWQYGSCVTFALGQRVSAPGQLPITALRGAMAPSAQPPAQ